MIIFFSFWGFIVEGMLLYSVMGNAFGALGKIVVSLICGIFLFILIYNFVLRFFGAPDILME